MSKEEKSKIEKTFRAASSFDDLFDAFHLALNSKIEDPELYKTLLANPALSIDELNLFTNKAAAEFPADSFEFFLWTGNVIESDGNFANMDAAFSFFEKAHFADSNSPSPLINSLKLINYDIDIPINKIVLEFAEKNLEKGSEKGAVCKALADVFSKLGEPEKAEIYHRLSEHNARKGK